MEEKGLLHSTLFWGFVTLILAYFGLSGRLVMIAAKLCLIAAWITAMIGIIKSKRISYAWLKMIFIAVIGIGLYGLYVCPEQNKSLKAEGKGGEPSPPVQSTPPLKAKNKITKVPPATPKTEPVQPKTEGQEKQPNIFEQPNNKGTIFNQPNNKGIINNMESTQ